MPTINGGCDHAPPIETPIIPLRSDPVIEEVRPEDYCDVVKRTRKDNLSRGNMGHAMLVQIPGVSGNVAKTLMEGYTSWAEFYTHLQQNPEYLNTIKITTSTGKQQRLSKTVVSKVREYLL